MTSQFGGSGYPPVHDRGNATKNTRGLDRDPLACAVYEQREMLLRCVATLSDQEWDAACPVPAPPAGVVRLDEPHRTVREVVAHLLVVDDMVLGGGALRAWAGLRRLEHPGAWDLRRVRPLAALPVPELVTLLARRGEQFARLVSHAPSAVRRLPVAGPFGRSALAGLVGRRVLHEWLHAQDIAAAVDPSTPAGMSRHVGAIATEAVLRLLPEAVLSRIPLAAGVLRLVVELPRDAGSGAIPRSIWGLDFGRRQFGPRVIAPANATIRVAAPALALLAHGRGDRLRTGPSVDVDGSATMAEAFLSALATPLVPAPCPGITSPAVA